MNLYLITLDVGLNANDEYDSYMNDILLGKVYANSKEDALNKIDFDINEFKNSTTHWVETYDYQLNATIIDEIDFVEETVIEDDSFINVKAKEMKTFLSNFRYVGKSTKKYYKYMVKNQIVAFSKGNNKFFVKKDLYSQFS